MPGDRISNGCKHAFRKLTSRPLTAQASGAEKKQIALQMLVDLAHSHGLGPPVLLLHTAIEAAVRLTKK